MEKTSASFKIVVLGEGKSTLFHKTNKFYNPKRIADLNPFV